MMTASLCPVRASWEARGIRPRCAQAQHVKVMPENKPRREGGYRVPEENENMLERGR
jgi:hypothetical protein